MEALKKLLLVGVARVIVPQTTAQLCLAILYVALGQAVVLACRPYKRGAMLFAYRTAWIDTQTCNKVITTHQLHSLLLKEVHQG